MAIGLTGANPTNMGVVIISHFVSLCSVATSKYFWLLLLLSICPLFALLFFSPNRLCEERKKKETNFLFERGFNIFLIFVAVTILSRERLGRGME